MQCPVCPETSLVMSERQGVEIDYCPKCRGIWLDRGELDKILERSAAQEAPVQPVHQQAAQYQQPQQQQYGHYADKHHGHGHGYQYKKKKSFLEELFD